MRPFRLVETMEPTARSYRIAEMPSDERPRERLLSWGSEVLSDGELVAVLLRSGRPGASALEVARELLEECGGLAGLLGAHPSQLRRSGLGDAKLATLLAAIEMGRRLARSRLQERRPLARPEEAASYLAMRYFRRDQEVMGALYLDTRNRLMAEREIFCGTLNRAAAEPREILKEGLLRGAAGVIVFHSHPSGDPSPSAEDLLFTRRLAQAGEVVGIRLVDHLIVGGAGRWVSLRQRRAW